MVPIKVTSLLQPAKKGNRRYALFYELGFNILFT